MKKSILAFATAAVLAGAISNTATACSYFNFEATDGNQYIGRTNELPNQTDEHFVVVPRGFEMRDSTTTHGFVGIRHGDTEMISSGLNEHGVSIEALGYWAGEYADMPISEADATSLSIVSTLLGQAKSTDEAVEIVENLVVAYEDMKQFNGVKVAFHYAINDGKRAVVVEHEDGGKPMVYENTIGVMTNDPSFPQQIETAKQAIKLVNSRQDDDKAVFPGFDTESVGRLERLAAQNASYNLASNMKANDARDEGVNRAWSMVNNAEIVAGTMYWDFLAPEPQIIAYGNVVDIADKAYYFCTYDNPMIRKVDLDDINFATASYSATAIYGTEPTFVEVLTH
ncbi:linear amide C-N hydrolase [Alginatibacterium sediminis]|uniref:Linear amide C-N hydrolase n=1 Tax=Alginatibacterium sediminis TaxID=2164068 RepID=A0A420EGD2_9ALTE|nr:linear amide C-N hydrolase [Alginatibacterium sediminis]RKF19771.1 linear amide C-N hydrolase [Alginatibacterium sediminis]